MLFLHVRVEINLPSFGPKSTRFQIHKNKSCADVNTMTDIRGFISCVANQED